MHFGFHRLALLLRLFQEIRQETNYGAIEVIVADGKVQGIKKVTSFK